MVLPNYLTRKNFFIFVGSCLSLLILTYGFVTTNRLLFHGQAAETDQVSTYTIQNKIDVMNIDGSEVLSSPDIAWYGTGKSTSASILGLRFTGTPLPADAIIRSAKVSLTSSKDQWITASGLWSVENQVEPQYFGSGTPLAMRTLLPETKLIRDNKRWYADKSYSYDITNQIKAHHDQVGNTPIISIIIKGRASSWARRYFYANPAFGKAPTLTIVWAPAGSETLPTSPTPTPLPASPTPSMSSMPMSSPSPTSTPAPSPTVSPSPITSTGQNSMAMGKWTPATQDTCTKEEHDGYFAIGPDGKKYPTWHPPVHKRANGTTCTFGHEHGRDPAGSDLLTDITAQYGGVLFGYGNEKLDEFNTATGITNGMRHEDHVGHKIEWENNVVRRVNNCANTVASPGCFDSTATNVSCDFLMKVHQGTHSPDAFANNVHELVYAVQCTDGTKVIATKMVVFGKPGEFVDNDGKSRVVQTGIMPMPMNSPSSNNSVRFIPTNVGVSNQILVPQGKWSLYSNGLYEDWVSSNYLQRPGSSDWIAYFDPHFAVFGPSRFHDPSAPNQLRRSIDVCYMTENNGTERARGGECDGLTNYGQNMTPIAYDDPRSPFNGVSREFYFNNTGINNRGGPTAWYTDPYGRSAQTTAAPGFIKQYVAAIDNRTGVTYESDAIGADRWYGGQGVHAPN